MENIDLLREILERAKEQIISNIESKGIKASGRTQNSLRVEQTDTGIRLVGGGAGAAPIHTLEVGRPGGKVPKGFYEIIKQWSRDKGFQFESETRRNSFAYLTAKKIQKEGTERHRNNRNDIYSEVVREAREDINRLLPLEIVKSIKIN
jgi:hypothetical protein